MKTLNKYVGLDVHKDTTATHVLTAVAVAEGGREREVRLYGQVTGTFTGCGPTVRSPSGVGPSNASGLS